MAKHCDEYLDDPTQPECLRRFLDYHCRPAAPKYPTGDEGFDQGLEERLGITMWRDPVPVLFARHEGRPVRVTMASRFGDVGITKDLDTEHGYGKRVAVEDLTDFSADRPCSWGERVYTNGVDCAQGSDDPTKPKSKPATIVVVDEAHGTWGDGFMGNRAERRAAAARARRA